ncbi:unnamed protein product [Arctogadus glacialis]
MGVVPSHPYRQARGDGSFMGPAGGTEAGSSSPVGQGGRVHGHVSRSRAMPCEVALLATAITSPLLSRNRKGSCSAGRGGLSRGCSSAQPLGQLMVLKEFEEVVHGSELVPGGPAFVIPEFLEEGTALDPRFKGKVEDAVWYRMEEALINRGSHQNRDETAQALQQVDDGDSSCDDASSAAAQLNILSLI